MAKKRSSTWDRVARTTTGQALLVIWAGSIGVILYLIVQHFETPPVVLTIICAAAIISLWLQAAWGPIVIVGCAGLLCAELEQHPLGVILTRELSRLSISL